MAQALETVVRFLNPSKDKWVGTGFLVPPESGTQGVFVMTCAHVIADALGDSDLGFSDEAPTAEVSLIFRDRTSTVHTAKVISKTWRAAPKDVQDPGGAVDMVVLKIDDLDQRPDGTRFPRFSDKPYRKQEVIAYGPRTRGQTKLAHKTFWPPGNLSEMSRADELEFVMQGNMTDNIIFGGFSGGPLTDGKTYEVLGMVRTVQRGENRRAYAIPVKLLADVWGSILSRRASEQRSIHPVFDLIGREEQAGILSLETRKRIEAANEDGTSHAPMTFLVSGPFDEDHVHMNRRAFIEIADHKERGVTSANLSYGTLKFPAGQNHDERLALLKEGILQQTNAAGTATEELQTALERSSPDGWLFHLSLSKGASDEDGTLLKAFLTFWDEIAKGTACELYLHLSFVYDPSINEKCGTAKLHETLTDNAGVALEPLRPITMQDISNWTQLLLAHQHIEDYGIADELTYQVEDLFEGADEMPMRKLRRAISKAKIDPDKL